MDIQRRRNGQHRLRGCARMNDPKDGVLEKWSERHFGELALWRTVGQGVNIILSIIVIAKLFGWI